MFRVMFSLFSLFSLFVLSSVSFFVCVLFCYCVFMYFQSLGGSLWSLVGRLDVLGSAWGAVGAFLWALGTSLRVLGGSLGGRWEYLGVLVGSRGLPGRSSGRPWGCLGILGDTLGVPGCSWGLLGRLRGGSCGVLGESLSGPSAHMLRTPMFHRVLFFVALASLFGLFYRGTPHHRLMVCTKNPIPSLHKDPFMQSI